MGLNKVMGKQSYSCTCDIIGIRLWDREITADFGNGKMNFGS